MTEIPNMPIECDHTGCTQHAASIAYLTHMKNNQCDPQSIALCDTHVGAWIVSLQKLQDAIYHKGPMHCPNCQTPLPVDYTIGMITRLQGVK